MAAFSIKILVFKSTIIKGIFTFYIIVEDNLQPIEKHGINCNYFDNNTDIFFK